MKKKRVPESFAQALAQVRKARGLSQSQAAARIGVPVRSLQEWEQGRMVPDAFKQQSILDKL